MRILIAVLCVTILAGCKVKIQGEYVEDAHEVCKDHGGVEWLIAADGGWFSAQCRDGWSKEGDIRK